MGAGRVLCDDVLRRRMRTCVLSVSSTVGRLVGRSVCRSRHYVSALWCRDKNYSIVMSRAGVETATEKWGG